MSSVDQAIEFEGEQSERLVFEIANRNAAVAVHNYGGGRCPAHGELAGSARGRAMASMLCHLGDSVEAPREPARELDLAAHPQPDDRARLRELCEQTESLLEAGELHEARRVNAKARNLSRRVYGAAAITLRPSPGRFAR